MAVREQTDLLVMVETRGIIAVNEIGVNDKVIEQWIVNIFIEVLSQITPPSPVFLLDKFECRLPVEIIVLLRPPDPLLKGPHQSDVKDIRQLAGDHVAAAAHDNDISHLCKAQYGFGRFLHEGPG
ncbi:MAG: hypothetical protein ABSE25_05095 [Syntrophorhabdales bacterium]